MPDRYHLMRDSFGPRRQFRVTVGLREGWDASAPVHSLAEAAAAAKAWMAERAGLGRNVLSGMFTRGEVVYPRGGAIAREPVAIFAGEALPAELGDCPDDEIETMLNEVAARMAAALDQDQVHVAYRDRAWTLSRR